MGKLDYHERQAQRRERYEELANKAEGESNAQRHRAHSLLDPIPLGQPILVGHHSEKRHRRTLDRADNAMRKSVEASKKAEYYTQKAASVGCSGISSDDPDAIEKLQDKLDTLKRSQETMKVANKIVKAKKLNAEEKTAKLIDLGFSEKSASSLLEPDCFGNFGFAPYSLQNNNANIRRVEQRIQSLIAAEQTPAQPDTIGNGYTIREDKEDNRLLFIFDAKPSKEVCQLMKSRGFHWSKFRKAWCRKLTDNARWSSQRVAADLQAHGY